MKQRRNILIITAIFPYPLNSGGAQAQFSIVNELRREHNVFIMFNQNRENRLENMERLAEMWPEVRFIPYMQRTQMRNIHFMFNMLKRGLQTYLTPRSRRLYVDKAIRSVSIYKSGRLERFIRDVIEKYDIDIVQTEFYPTIGLVDCFPDHVLKVFIQHEIHFIKNERLFKNMKLTRREMRLNEESREFEISCLNAYDVVVTLTERDKTLLEENGVKANICVSPAAVITEEKPYKEYEGRLTFVGSSSHTPNREGAAWFIEMVAPMLKDVQNLSMDLIGAGWSGVESDSISVNVRGFVDDLSQAIQGSIMIVPILSGSGMRMKILEAAAVSVPFITTSVGVEGLDFVNGESCLIADTPEQFAGAIRSLIADRDLCRRLGEAANEVFRQKYTAKVLARVRNEVYIRHSKK